MESNLTKLYREKCESAMEKISGIQQFRDADEMVDLVFKVGRSLFDTPLDQQTTDFLLRTGGKLTGAYTYLTQKSTYARAERDVFEQKCNEVEKELMLKQLADGKYKVTEARARVSADIEELKEFVIQKDVVKNQWENIAEACQMMVSFMQSAIKVKESEKFNSSRMQNNG
jgi:hypothetical protein